MLLMTYKNNVINIFKECRHTITSVVTRTFCKMRLCYGIVGVARPHEGSPCIVSHLSPISSTAEKELMLKVQELLVKGLYWTEKSRHTGVSMNINWSCIASGYSHWCTKEAVLSIKWPWINDKKTDRFTFSKPCFPLSEPSTFSFRL